MDSQYDYNDIFFQQNYFCKSCCIESFAHYVLLLSVCSGGTSQIIDEDEEEEEEEESVFQRMAGYMCKIKTDCEQVRHLTLPGSGRSAVGREDKGKGMVA